VCAWAALISAFASTLTTQDSLRFRLWAGLAAVGLGAIGWIRSRALAGRGRWAVYAALLLGGGFALSTPQFAWLWPPRGNTQADRAYTEKSSREAKRAQAVQSYNRGIELSDGGRLNGAETYFSEAIRISREIDDKPMLAAGLQGRSYTLYELGRLDEAMTEAKKSERLYRDLTDWHGVAENLNTQGLVLCKQGHLDGAMERCREQEKLGRKLPDKRGQLVLAAALMNQGFVFSEREYLHHAIECYQEAENIFRTFDKKKFLADCYAALARVYQKMRDDLEMRKYARKAVELRDQLRLPSDPALRQAAGMQTAPSGSD